MPDSGGFKVEGLTQVIRDLQAMGFEVDDLKRAFSRIAAEGAQVASQEAPRRTGRLSADVRGNRAKSKAVVTAGRSSIPYAGPINYGWGSQASGFKHGRYATGIRGSYAGNPFMQRTDQRMEPKAIQMLEDEINQIIREKRFK